MSALSIETPFPIFTDIDGQPLENGYVWIGTANLNPITNPINVYWDAALTVAAVQPIRTLAGYPSNSGTPARLYANSDYSIQVQNRNGSVVYSAPASTERFGDLINASQVVYNPAGTGAVSTTVQAKLRESVSVLDFGADPTGVADSTAAIQAAVTYAETFSSEGPVEILFTPGGVFDLKMVFITTGGVKLNGNGCTIVQNHDNVNSITVGGAGQYKVSNAFMIKRGAADVEITGFDFTTDDASFPALAAGYGSYFASIGAQFVDRLNIHHNRFRSGQLRALFIQGGKYLRFVENNMENNGMTIHIGYLLNIYFYDPSTDTSVKYSPIAPYVVGNIFDGFTSVANTTCLFLTGAIRFTVRDNKLLNMNEATALRAILIYSNDFGPYDEDGTALAVIQGTCEGNLVEGTFLTGIEVSGDSSFATATWTNSYRMAINVNSNTVQGIGNGIKNESAKGVNISRNWVKVSKSPLFLDQDFADCSVKDNYFECTSSGQNATTIYSSWAVGASNFTFSGNIVVTPTGDQYAMRATTSLNGLTMNDNLWDFNSDVAACRGIVLTLGGKSEINNNRFDVDTDTASIFIFSMNGNTQTGTLNANGNAVIATAGTGATTLRFGAFENFKEVRLSNNDTGGAVLIEDALRSYIRDNTIILPSGNTSRGIYCDNTGYAQKALVEIHSNYVLQPAALNVPGIGIASNNDATNNTLSKVTMNRVEGNSTGTLIQQTSAGVIEVIGNTIINNGTGGTTTGVTGTATLVNL